MSKNEWMIHIKELSGLLPPSEGGNMQEWKSFLKFHFPQIGSVKHWCPICKARQKTRKQNKLAKAKNEALAMVCGTSARQAKLDMGL